MARMGNFNKYENPISLFVFCSFPYQIIIIMYKWLKLTILLEYALACNCSYRNISLNYNTRIFMFDCLMYCNMFLVEHDFNRWIWFFHLIFPLFYTNILYSDMWSFRRHVTVVMIQINLKKPLTTVYNQQMALKYSNLSFVDVSLHERHHFLTGL